MPGPASKPPRATGAPALLFPVGHYLGVHHRLSQPAAVRHVRCGATFHDLNEDQFAVWVAAHGTPEAIEENVAWHRESVPAHPRVAGLTHVSALIDQLLGMGLLVEVVPGTDQAIEFAKSHRLVPLMLGLGNSGNRPDVFGIGFLHQPVLEVSFGIYDLWQWSTMDDSLWATCENAADVAQRAGSGDAASTDPVRHLSGFLPSLHSLLLPNAAYLDTSFRLSWPTGAPARSPSGSTVARALAHG
jgi:hypothetical protein